MNIQLLYSTKCQACMELWRVINNEGIQQMFIPVCLDRMSSKDISQLKLEKIPSIIIVSPNTPPQILEGPKHCGNWLNQIIQNRRNTMMQQIDTQRRLIQKQQQEKKMQEGGALEFIGEEMEGISDAYSYLATDMYQPKNFIPVGQEENYRMATIQMKENKISTDELSRNISDLRNNREKDSDEMKRTMEQNQLQIIMNRANQ